MRSEDRKENIERIVSILLAVLILLLLMVFLRMLIFDKKVIHKGKGEKEQTRVVQEKTEEPKEGASKEDGSGRVESKEETQQPAKEEQGLLFLAEEDKYRGNLILVNYQYPYHFVENQARENLVNIKEHQSISYPVGKEQMQLSQAILPYIDRMIGDLRTQLQETGIGISSAYRSMEYQSEIFSQYEEDYGIDYAKAYVANPGNSEHHTGLALDFSIYYDDGSEGSFSESQSAAWMANNSYRYGFIRRYQADKAAITRINNEAWHFRYVGEAHASYMHANNLCLEEYIDYLKKNTSKENPLRISTEKGENYLVYASREMQIEKPLGEYEVSGDNIDGYIITQKVS